MLKYKSAMATIFFVLSTCAAINEKLLEAEVPVRIVHFSASVCAIFFPRRRAPGKKCFCLYVIFSFLLFRRHVLR